jgi:hypothetical protein
MWWGGAIIFLLITLYIRKGYILCKIKGVYIMVRPISNQSSQVKTKSSTPVRKDTGKVKIGGVEYNANQVEKSEVKTVNGKKTCFVQLKPGVTIMYPEQKDSTKSPRVESLGLRNEWYNPDESHIDITDVDGATIWGCKNKSDYINLNGRSSGNTVIVNQEESLFVNRNVRKDRVDLGANTSGNRVIMDEDDILNIDYTKPTMSSSENPIEILKVEGEGISDQEVQLKDALREKDYNYHKSSQRNP